MANSINQLWKETKARIRQEYDAAEAERIRGTKNDDLINGTENDDKILSRNGDDTINGLAGDDLIKSGAGNDDVDGGEGYDSIRAGNGNDTIRGGDDDDYLNGGGDDDLLIGDRGNDIMSGGGGNDIMVWNPGDGSDFMDGDGGHDTAVANGGNIDEIFTLKQDKRWAVFDRVDPFPFSLFIRDTEVVEVNGFGGNDSFTVEDLSRTDVKEVVFNGGEGDDLLDASATNVRVTAQGGVGKDTIIGGDNNDDLRGGDDDDLIIGDRGDDQMYGEGGNDIMVWNPGDGSDLMDGGEGIDTALVNGGGIDEIFTLKQHKGQAIFDRVEPFPFNLKIRSTEIVEVNGFGGNDSFTVGDLSETDVEKIVFDGGEGNDLLDASETNVQVFATGGLGDDTIIGGDADDTLEGGGGNDLIIGDRGNDQMYGQGGDDIMVWNPGDGTDFMNGGNGIDVAVANGGNADEQFTLGQNGTQAVFDRVNPFPFSLFIDETEVMTLNGNGGNDSFVVDDVSQTDLLQIIFNGGEGDDTLDAIAANIRVLTDGGLGSDHLVAGSADDLIRGGADVDTLTGGLGGDGFVYGDEAIGSTDFITDYTVADDRYFLEGASLGIEQLIFQSGLLTNLAEDANVIILSKQGFANAGAAAAAIADDSQVNAEEGVFVYFNETLGIGRLVYSENLGDGGNISVLANMQNLTDISDLADFTSDNFGLV